MIDYAIFFIQAKSEQEMTQNRVLLIIKLTDFCNDGKPFIAWVIFLLEQKFYFKVLANSVSNLIIV